jgi:hypothetical protein
MTGLAGVHASLAADGEHEGYLRAIELFSAALEIRTLENQPLKWVETTFNLAAAYEGMAGATGDDKSLDAAETAYMSVLNQVSSDASFGGGAARDSTSFLGYAVKALQRLDRAGIPEPRTPPGFAERKVRGKLLFLRPLMSARKLMLLLSLAGSGVAAGLAQVGTVPVAGGDRPSRR